ncbi:MAG: efflux RND transporter periplasmic adaptor subunit [Planctomycetes bacterium]|nr:efflux RND transporter periplasmic adaptor subunit [Planctomycetota bacterium]MCH9727902.1 efflux RND transporter periplasmic adaptor subunit [Planctomycetota bacterium]MCH9778337.1 efflux RND transporter periplasmic adaptor subunit [Planctomycetota bacterium]MCH9792903.1 efflux RND transporter periplasmic adaptor subunit [Planctomycetota bacterium]MDF1742475.1 HlyD family efflux transporter periplasmic adaptor subunit [Gimesia sp.]
MTTDESASIENLWQEIEELVLGLAQLSRSEIPSQKFYSELLDRAVRGMSALGGILWVPDSSGVLEIEQSLGLNPESNSEVPLSEEERAQHRLVLQEALQANQPATLAPRTGLSEQHQGKNPFAENLILCPVKLLNHPETNTGILEVIHHPPKSFAAQDGYLRFISALCEIADDFCQHKQFQKLQEMETLWEEFESFSEHIHLHLNSQKTAYILANEGRILINCDRVSVLQRTGNSYRLIAASGVDAIERRSESVQRLEKLTGRIQSLNRPYWIMEADQKYPPQISEPLHAYLDLSSSRSFMIFPLRHLTEEQELDSDDLKQQKRSSTDLLTVGVLVVEQFHETDHNDTLLERALAVSRHGGTALFNALQFESFPFFPLLKYWSHSPTRKKQLTWRNIITSVLILGLITAGLVLTPANFSIEGSGTLQPIKQQNIFATSNGIVDQIFVQQGEQVQTGSTLITLRDSELDLELSRVRGEIQTGTKRLAVIQAARLELTATDAKALLQSNRLTAEEEELNVRLKSLGEQLDLLKKQQEALTLKSPLAGEVLTWDFEEKLLTRPVQRGQRLLTVANLKGPWILNMQVPDSEIGHILEAQRKSPTPLNVSFLLLTDLDQTYQGTIEKIAATAEPDEDGIPTVQITVKLDHELIKGLRPGASVLPEVDCGTRSLGYVWLRRLIETVQRDVLFF